ncbi:hypothetical protein [Nocardia asiatica]|uniref:hypothetical protein n=1 Tax=Nocardia asiatica TaxID=209252 RepID=UPI003EE0CACA
MGGQAPGPAATDPGPVTDGITGLEVTPPRVLEQARTPTGARRCADRAAFAEDGAEGGRFTGRVT